jgi:hypothetical protein
MRSLISSTLSFILLTSLQMLSFVAMGQSIHKESAVGISAARPTPTVSSQLSLLCYAHRQRLKDWELGGRPGRISSPTGSLVMILDDSPARYAAEIRQMCDGIAEPDSASILALQVEREAIRSQFENVQPLVNTDSSAQAWSGLPRRQAPVGADAFDNTVNRKNGTGKNAGEQLAQRIPELSPDAIAEQSIDIVDFVGVLGQVVLDMSAIQNPDAALAAKQILSSVGLAEYTASDQAIAKGKEAKIGVDSGISAQHSDKTQNTTASNTPPTSNSTSGKEEITYLNYQNSTNSNCVEVRGNSLANKCDQTLLIAFCVTNPQQTKNFFDGSDAMRCGSGGGLDNISAGKSHGLVLYGVIQYFACPYTDYYTPARMKTKLTPQGYYVGTCGNDGNLTGGKVGWTIGGTVVSQPKR